MTEREALLRAVCENPDDDLPRLVFADWLEEHDEPERAEFIRLQISAAHRFERGEPIDTDPDWVRACELERIHSGSWPLGCPPDRHRVSFRMWRGFPFWVVAPDRHALARLENMPHELPILEYLSLKMLSQNGIKYLAQSRYTSKIRLLTIGSVGGWVGKLTDLFDNHDWKALRYLSFRGCELGYSGCDALADKSGLSLLRVLDLGNAQIGNGGIAALCRSATFSNLERLLLGGNIFSARVHDDLKRRFGDRVVF